MSGTEGKRRGKGGRGGYLERQEDQECGDIGGGLRRVTLGHSPSYDYNVSMHPSSSSKKGIYGPKVIKTINIIVL